MLETLRSEAFFLCLLKIPIYRTIYGMNIHGAQVLEAHNQVHTLNGAFNMEVTAEGLAPQADQNAFEPITPYEPVLIDVRFPVTSGTGFGNLDMNPMQDILPPHAKPETSFRDWQLRCLETTSLSFVSKWQVEIAMAWIFQGTHAMRDIGHLSLLGHVTWDKNMGTLQTTVWERGFMDEYERVAAVNLVTTAHAAQYVPERTLVDKLTIEDPNKFDFETKVGQSPIVTVGEGMSKGPEEPDPVTMFSLLMSQFDGLEERWIEVKSQPLPPEPTRIWLPEPTA
jgi:hypothetical protein